MPQPIERQHVAGLGRRGRLHLFEMESQQVDNVWAAEIAFVKGQFHSGVKPSLWFERKLRDA